jgi:PAS domain S-box-containing protein
LIVLLAIPAASLIINSWIAARNEAINSAKAEILRFVCDVAGRQQAIATGAEQLAITSSLLPRIRSKNRAAATALFSELLKKNPQYANILVCDKTGLVWASAVPHEGKVSMADRRFFQEAARTGMFSSGEYVMGRIVKQPVMSFGYPVKNTANELITVIEIVLDLGYVQHMFQNLNPRPGSSFSLLDRRGTILIMNAYDSLTKKLVGRRDIREELFTKITKEPDEGTFGAIGNDGRFRLHAYKRISLPHESTPYIYIRSSIPLVSVTSKANATMFKELSALASLFLIGLLLAWYIGQRLIVDPAIILKRASAQLAAGADTVNVSSVVKGSEFGEVARAFDSMAKALVERKAALCASEQRWATTLSSIGDAVIATDTEGKASFMNAVAETLTGWTLGVASMKPVAEVFHIINEQTHSEAESPVARVLREGMAVGLANHTVLVKKDGTEVPIACRGAPIRDKDGNVTGVVLVFHDITERKQAEEALRESEERYRVAIESSNDGIALLRENRHIYANRRFLEILGYSSLEEVAGKTHYRIIHPDDLERVASYNQRRQRGEAVPDRYECRGLRKNGEVVFLEVSATGATYRGEPISLVFIRDVTKRRKAEEALLKSEALLREAQETAHIGHWELDISTMTPVWSEEIFRISGLDPEEGELSFEAHEKITHPDDWGILNNAVTTAIAEGIPYNIEFRMLRPDKTIRWLHAIGYPKKDSEGRIVSLFGTAQDVTEKKLMENALAESEGNFRHSLENSPLGVRIVDIEGETNYANRAILDIYGYDSLDELRETPVLNRYTQESYAEFQIRRQRRKRGDFVPSEYEIGIVRKDGTVRHLQVFRKNVLWNGQERFQVIYQDITERKKAEEALRLANTYNRSLIEASLDPLVTISPEGKISDVNVATEKATGYSRDELIGTDFSDYFTEPEKARKGYLQVFSRGFVRDYELAIRHRNGQITSVLYNASVYKDEAGRVIGVFAAARDVTEQRHAEEALRINEERYRMGQAIGHVGNWEYNVQTTQFWGSDEAKRIYGFDPEYDSFSTDEVYNCIPERERVHQALLDLIEEGKAYDLEFEILPRNSSEPRFIASIAELQRDGEGSPLMVAGVIQDITKRKLAEKALRDSEEKYRSIFDNAVEGIFQTTPDGKYLSANPALARMHGYDSPMELMKSVKDIGKQHYVDPKDRDRLKELLWREGSVQDFEVKIHQKDGDYVWVSISAKVIKDSDGQVLFYEGTALDINARKKAEDSLKRQDERLRKLSKRLAEVHEEEKRNMARELHDRLGGNLTAIGINLNILNLQLHKTRKPVARSRLDDSLSLLSEATECMRGMMFDLRPPAIDDYGLPAALRWFTNRFSSRTGLEVTLICSDFDRRLDSSIEIAFFRIAQEALSNVAKHAQASRVMVSLELGEGKVGMEISDNGVGLPDSKVDSADATEGWGVFIMKERAEAIGGYCAIESASKEGTRIWVEVPL